MTITREIKLAEFEFWSGAKGFADKLTYSELTDVEQYLEDCFFEEDEVPSETDINDLFWFQDDLICEWLDLDINEVYKR